jgi:hypothetical protein
MLRSITAKQFREWQAFDLLDPIGEERDDFRAASIVQALYNIARDGTRHPNPWPITDFLVAFGDRPRADTKQSVEFQERLINDWCNTSNAILKEKNQCPPPSTSA